jgi:hypothetical protein
MSGRCGSCKQTFKDIGASVNREPVVRRASVSYEKKEEESDGRFQFEQRRHSALYDWRRKREVS